MTEDSVFHHPVAKQLFICHGVCVSLTHYKDGNIVQQLSVFECHRLAHTSLSISVISVYNVDSF